MTKTELDAAVNRFLSWKLPADFYPDCGIQYTRIPNTQPVGTNLFTADQARAMLEYVLAASPVPPSEPTGAHPPDCRCHFCLNVRAFEDAVAAEPAPQAEAVSEPIKDHEIAQLVNKLRDIAIEFHATQQLRDRIANVVLAALRK